MENKFVKHLDKQFNVLKENYNLFKSLLRHVYIVLGANTLIGGFNAVYGNYVLFIVNITIQLFLLGIWWYIFQHIYMCEQGMELNRGFLRKKDFLPTEIINKIMEE